MDDVLHIELKGKPGSEAGTIGELKREFTGKDISSLFNPELLNSDPECT